MAAVEASYAARAAEERANMLRGSLDDKSGELEWMRSEHAKVVKQIADLESAANAAADTQRKVDAKASAIVEESRARGGTRRAAAAARDPYPDRNVDAQREADLAEQLRCSRRVRPMRVRRDGGEAGGGSRRRGQGRADRGGGVPRRGGAGAGTRAHRRGAGRAVQRGGHGDGFVPTETGPGPVLPDGGAGREQGARGVVHARGGGAGEAKGDGHRGRRGAGDGEAHARREDARGRHGCRVSRRRQGSRRRGDRRGCRAEDEKEAAAERERNLRDELAQAAAVRDRNASIENLEATVTELERRTREATFEAKKRRPRLSRFGPTPPPPRTPRRTRLRTPSEGSRGSEPRGT